MIAAFVLALGLGDSRRAALSVPPDHLNQPGVASHLDVAEKTDTAVLRALREGRYPWYDQATDRVRPVWPTRRPWVKWLRDRIESFYEAIDRLMRRFSFRGFRGLGFTGESIGTMLLMAVLVSFCAALLVLWARRGEVAAVSSGARTRLGNLGRLAELPEGIRPDSDDPWDEARRRRASGDFAGATVCLFAHQLLALDQLGMIQLGPGQTGRQYVRGLRDPELLDPVRETLALFEEVYYGRRVPAATAFEAVWKGALAFEERRSLLGAFR
jgi:hypothetical protein